MNGLENKTVSELKAIAKENNIKGYSKLKKAELIESIVHSFEEVEKATKEIDINFDNDVWYTSIKDNKILKIVADEDVQAPRGEEFDCIVSKMICFHKRHNLGDKHNYDEPYDLLVELVEENFTKNEIVEKFNNFRVEKSEDYENDFEVYSTYRFDEGRYVDNFCSKNLENQNNEIAEVILNNLFDFTEIERIVEVLKEKLVILPIYMYEHSGITIKTTPFGCEWDSGQVGFIYATITDIKNNYSGELIASVENMENILVNEVKLYDQYLNNETFGFVKYEINMDKLQEIKDLKESNLTMLELEDLDIVKEVDSCWGFYGIDLEEVKTNIKGCGFDNMLESLQ